jgi:hypothetical protein
MLLLGKHPANSEAQPKEALLGIFHSTFCFYNLIKFLGRIKNIVKILKTSFLCLFS